MGWPLSQITRSYATPLAEEVRIPVELSIPIWGLIRPPAVPTEARNVQNRSRRQRVYLKSLVLELHAEFEHVRPNPEATQAFHSKWEVRRGVLEEVRGH